MNVQEDDLSDWWDRVLTEADQVDDVVALWFGLVELVTTAGNVWTVYVVGCGEFDPDDWGDWRSSIVWIPDGRYVALPGANQIKRDVWAVLDRAVQLITALAPQHRWPGAALAATAVGFDDGVPEIVWTRC